MTQTKFTRSVAAAVGTSLFVMATIGCGPSPVSKQPERAPVAAPADPLEAMVPAPGAEQLPPDQHPELAHLTHLTEVTLDSLTQSIASYVEDESKRQGGVFPVPDPDHGTPLELTLTKVHRERLSKLADGRYFACADFTGPKGGTYDVDIFMRTESTGVVPSEMIVHKVNGAARFNWSERDGVWSPVPVAQR
jgi:hypothetical protein